MSRARGSWSIVRSRRNFKYFTCASLLILLLVTVNTRSSTLILQEDSLPDVKCRMVGATDPIFIFCNWPGDWSCRSELFTVLAEQFSTKVRTFVFSTECMVFDLRPRIFFVGGLTDVEQAQQHPFYASSDLRVLLNFEPSEIPESIAVNSAFNFDVMFTSNIQDSFDQAEPVLLTWPYVSFALSQSSSLDLSQLEARVAPTALPEMFGAYATMHCRALHRTKFYTMVADKLEPLFHLNQQCGARDRFPKDLGVMSDRGDERNFMRNIISRYAQFKYVIVFENKLIDTYITEKLVLARLSGAIPVYFGGKLARVMFNPSAFIDCSPDSMDDLDYALKRCIVELQSVHENDSKWRAMYEAPFLNRYDHDIAMDLMSEILLNYLNLAMIKQSADIPIPSLRAKNLKSLCTRLNSQLWLSAPTKLCKRWMSS